MSLLLSILLACDGNKPPPSGTLVGNPGQASLALAPATGLAYETAVAARMTSTQADCEGHTEEDEYEPFDLFADTLAIDGTVCEIDLAFEDLHVEGTGPSATTFVLSLEPGTIFLAGDADENETGFVLELARPDWITADALGLPAKSEAVLEPESAGYESAIADVQDASGLYADADDDGVLSADERDAGAVLEADPDLAGDADSGGRVDGGCSGCAHGTRPSFAWLALVLLAFRRRR